VPVVVRCGAGWNPAADWQSNAARFSSSENSAKIVGRTPWSARVPLDPLFAARSISSKREGRPGGRPRTGGPPHNFCRLFGFGKNERHWIGNLPRSPRSFLCHQPLVSTPVSANENQRRHDFRPAKAPPAPNEFSCTNR
jgi:hypothetical protein